MDINTLPRLEKTVRFDKRFDDDWRYMLTRKVFFAIGDEAFFSLTKLLVDTWPDQLFQDNEITPKKFMALMPRYNSNAAKHIPDALKLIISLLNHIGCSPSQRLQLRQKMAGELLLIFNNMDDSEVPALYDEDFRVIIQVFCDLTELFYMLQWVELSVFAPETLPKAQKIYRNGQFQIKYRILSIN